MPTVGMASDAVISRASGSTVRFPGFLAVYSGGASGPQENGQGEKDAGENSRSGADRAKAQDGDGDGQADAIKNIFENQNWIVEAIREDYTQRQRILIAK